MTIACVRASGEVLRRGDAGVCAPRSAPMEEGKMSYRAMHQATRVFYSALVGVLALGLLGASPNQQIDQQATYEARVQRTEGGIPHIQAVDFASLGFGTGYAMAEDVLCLLADERFLTFSAERSRFLGEGAETSRATSSTSSSSTAARRRSRSIRGRRHSSAAPPRATTATCVTRASTTFPTKVAVGRRGCARSARSIGDAFRG